jgi:hypothetical protein
MSMRRGIGSQSSLFFRRHGPYARGGLCLPPEWGVPPACGWLLCGLPPGGGGLMFPTTLEEGMD